MVVIIIKFLASGFGISHTMKEIGLNHKKTKNSLIFVVHVLAVTLIICEL